VPWCPACASRSRQLRPVSGGGARRELRAGAHRRRVAANVSWDHPDPVRAAARAGASTSGCTSVEPERRRGRRHQTFQPPIRGGRLSVQVAAAERLKRIGRSRGPCAGSAPAAVVGERLAHLGPRARELDSDAKVSGHSRRWISVFRDRLAPTRHEHSSSSRALGSRCTRVPARKSWRGSASAGVGPAKAHGVGPGTRYTVRPYEHAANRARQPPFRPRPTSRSRWPSRRIASGVHRARRHPLLSGVLRSRANRAVGKRVRPPIRRSSNAPGASWPRPRRRRNVAGRSRHRARRRWCAADSALVINRDGTSPASRTRSSSTLPKRARIRPALGGASSTPGPADLLVRHLP